MKKIYTDENAARKHLEELRWSKFRYCPHCGETERTSATDSKNHKAGMYYCLSCEKTFTVTVGTIFERSHVPLHKWIYAFSLMCASKKGISSKQLERMLGVTYKTAWFMSHRIREAMTGSSGGMFGTGGGFVEADETYIGKDENHPMKPGQLKKSAHQKRKVLSLIDRESGKARSMVVDNLKAKNLLPILQANVAPQATLMTDEALHYFPIGRHFARHTQVNHSMGEYVFKHDKEIHTNTVESFFSIFKRGMKGVYQHCGQNHLQRYLNEFDFRYNNRIKLGIDDEERTANALKGASGKRLTYRRIDSTL